MGELVSRTVRFPEDIIAYIDAQEGTNFSKKLISLIHEHKDGDAERAGRMAQYDRYIAGQQERLQDLVERTGDVQQVCRELESISRQVRRILDSLPESTGPPG